MKAGHVLYPPPCPTTTDIRLRPGGGAVIKTAMFVSDRGGGRQTRAVDPKSAKNWLQVVILFFWYMAILR